MKNKIVIFLISLLLIPNFVLAKEGKEYVTFNECVDGDTAYFNIDGEKTKVRFLAIDTPETVKPNTAVQPFGKEASNYTCNAITNAKEIYLEYDSASDDTDKYGRVLAWIWVDGNLLEKELVQKGYAKVAYIYGKYKYVDQLVSIQSEAEKNKLGIWSEETTSTSTSTSVSTTTSTATSTKTTSNELSEKEIITIASIIILVIYAIINPKYRKKTIKKIINKI